MKTISIQNKKVIDKLLNNERYINHNFLSVPSNLIEPYMEMSKYYHWQSRPIFMGIIGTYCNFGGADINNTYLIEMNIPDKYCKLQDYYAWSDYIYFSELPKECDRNIEDFRNEVLGQFDNEIYWRKDIVYQGTVPFILKDWVQNIALINQDFIDLYNNTGGINMLKSFKDLGFPLEIIYTKDTNNLDVNLNKEENIER